MPLSKLLFLIVLRASLMITRGVAEDEKRSVIGLYVEEVNFPAGVVEYLRKQLIIDGNQLISEGIKTKNAMKISITEISELTDDTFKDFGILLLYTECGTLLRWTPSLVKREAHRPDFTTVLVTSDTCTRFYSPSVRHYLAQERSMQWNYLQVLLDMQIYEELNWKAMYLIYDDGGESDVMSYASMFREAFPILNRGSTIMAFNTSELGENVNESVREIFDAICVVPRAYNNFVAFGRLDTIAAIITEAFKHDLLTIESDFVLFLVDEEDWSEDATNQKFGASLSGNMTNMVLVRLKKTNADQQSLQYHAQVMHECLIDQYASTLREIVKRINAVRVSLPLAGQLHGLLRAISCPSDYRFEYGIFLIRNLFSVLDLHPFLVDKHDWEMGIGLGLHSADSKMFFYKTPYMMAGHPVRMYTAIDPPWQIMPPNFIHRPTFVTLDGISVQLYKELQQRFYLRYSYLIYDFLEEGINRTLSPWDAAVACLNNNYNTQKQHACSLQEYEMITMASVRTESKSKEVKFMYPFHHEPHVILSARPKPQSQIYLFLEPFTLEVWLLLLAIMVIVSISLYFIDSFKIDKVERTKARMTDCCLLTYGVLVQQGMNLFATSTSGRVLLTSWLMCAIIIGAMYCGSLVSFLTIPRLTPHIRNIDELLSSEGRVTWGIHNESTMLPYLMSATDERMTYIRKRIIVHPEITGDVMREVREGRHVILAAKTKLLFRLQEELNHTRSYDYVIGEEVFFDRVSFAVTTDFKLYPRINEEMKRIVSTGIVRKWKNEMWPKLDESYVRLTADDSDDIVISIYDFQSSIYALGLGCALGILVFALEILAAKCGKSEDKAKRVRDRSREER